MIKTLLQLESTTEEGKILKLDEGVEEDDNSSELFIVISKKDVDDRIICLTINQAEMLAWEIEKWLHR